MHNIRVYENRKIISLLIGSKFAFEHYKMGNYVCMYVQYIQAEKLFWNFTMRLVWFMVPFNRLRNFLIPPWEMPLSLRQFRIIIFFENGRQTPFYYSGSFLFLFVLSFRCGADII